jgi:dihydrofolate reductase
MRKVILGVAVSLDGFIEGPKGEYDWCFSDQDYGLKEFYSQIDTIFMGRKSFEMAKDNMQQFGSMKLYVFSRTLASPLSGAVLIDGDLVGSIQKIKQSAGKDIWLFGGAELTTSFVNSDFVDEYWLSVHPVVLGSGKPLFQGIPYRKWMELIQYKVYPTGLVSLRYRPALNKN